MLAARPTRHSCCLARLGPGLASLGSVTGLAPAGLGLDRRDTFARRYGQRGSHEAELSIPQPVEDPAWMDNQFAALRDSAYGPTGCWQTRKRAPPRPESCWHARTPPRRPRCELIARWAPVARDREAARSAATRHPSPRCPPGPYETYRACRPIPR